MRFSKNGELIKLSPGEMAALFANVVGKVGALDENGKVMLQQGLAQTMENTGKSEKHG